MVYAPPDSADISIHALREEGDVKASVTLYTLPNFYPRPPRGGRLRPLPALWFSVLFLSTPSARRATSAMQRHTS